MPDPTPQQLISDPRFHALPIDARMSALAGVDPDFAKLNPAQRVQAMTRLVPDSTPPEPQQLLNKPDQPGLQPASGIGAYFNRLGSGLSEGYSTTEPGLISAGAGMMQRYIAGKVAQRQQENQVAISKGQSLPNSPALNTALGMTGDTAGMVSGALSPQAAGITTAALVAPIPTAAGLIGYGGYQTVKNAGALKDLVTTGQANPQQVQEGLTGLATMAGGAAVGKGGIDARTSAANVPVDTPTVANTITKAFNPHPDDVPAFKQNVTQHIDSIIQDNGGKVPANRAELADATQQSATKARADYKALTDSVKDVMTYSGKTLGQLEARLSQINATLNPKYQKGGLTAINALNAEQSAALTQEAADLRQTINTETAKQLGIQPQDVSAARQKYGQLGDVADKMRWYLDNENYSANKVSNQPSQAPDMSLLGGANMVRNAVWNKIMGNPADKAVGNILNRYVPNQQSPLQVNPLDSGGSNPRQPAWRTVDQSGTQVPSADYTPDIQAAARKQAFSSIARRDMAQPNVLSDIQKRAIQQALSNRRQR